MVAHKPASPGENDDAVSDEDLISSLDADELTLQEVLALAVAISVMSDSALAQLLAAYGNFAPTTANASLFRRRADTIVAQHPESAKIRELVGVIHTLMKLA